MKNYIIVCGNHWKIQGPCQVSLTRNMSHSETPAPSWLYLPRCAPGLSAWTPSVYCLLDIVTLASTTMQMTHSICIVVEAETLCLLTANWIEKLDVLHPTQNNKAWFLIVVPKSVLYYDVEGGSTTCSFQFHIKLITKPALYHLEHISRQQTFSPSMLLLPLPPSRTTTVASCLTLQYM